jgi:hypothetical protein
MLKRRPIVSHAKAGGSARRRAPERDMPLPHERDEAPYPEMDRDVAPYGPTDRVEQAARDVEHGLVDTDRRGTPSDVPRPRRSRRRRS